MGTDTTPPSESAPEPAALPPAALPPAANSHIFLTGNSSFRSMANGAVTHISDTPLPLRMVDPAILANWDQPQPQLPQRSPPFVPGGPAEPPWPPVNNGQVLTSVRIDATVGVAAGVGAATGIGTAVAEGVGSTAGASAARAIVIGRAVATNLSLQPEHVASRARLFVEAIRSQIAAMPPTPNEPDKLEFHNGLVGFLEGLAAGLSELAETLDKMVANRGNANEPILLGKAATIANHLGIGAMDYIAKNREKLAGMMIQAGFYGAATLLAMSLGIDKEFLEAIAKIFGKGSK